MTGLDTLHVELAVVLGKTRMPLAQLLKLGRGAVVALETGHADPIEILANGHLIARGEVTVRAGAISVRILEMVRKPAVIRDAGARIGGGIAQRDAQGRADSGEVQAAA